MSTQLLGLVASHVYGCCKHCTVCKTAMSLCQGLSMPDRTGDSTGLATSIPDSPPRSLKRWRHGLQSHRKTGRALWLQLLGPEQVGKKR